MKKRVLAIALVLCMAVMSVACGKQQVNSEVPKTEEVSEVVEVQEQETATEVSLSSAILSETSWQTAFSCGISYFSTLALESITAKGLMS